MRCSNQHQHRYVQGSNTKTASGVACTTPAGDHTPEGTNLCAGLPYANASVNMCTSTASPALRRSRLYCVTLAGGLTRTLVLGWVADLPTCINVKTCPLCACCPCWGHRGAVSLSNTCTWSCKAV